MKILFIGDIVSRLGRIITKEIMPDMMLEHKIDAVIANGENSAAGVGITKRICDEIHGYGIDVITGGNHIWDKKEILEDMSSCPGLVRPANYPDGAPGVGAKVFTTKSGIKYGVLNLVGRVFMPAVDDPFKVADKYIEQLKLETPIILVDFHAEATSEKSAIGWYLDGKVSAVIGTHTHVQTADERILPQGTAFISDAGMVASRNSVIGVDKNAIIKRFLTSLPERFEPEKQGPGIFNAILLEIDDKTGKAISIERINRVVENVSAD